jgi:hypothetical protein
MAPLPLALMTILLATTQPTRVASTTTMVSSTLPILEFVGPLSLVKAEVVKTAPLSGGLQITLKVLHVYSGTIIVNGGTFTAGSTANGADSIGMSVWPVPVVGERGLWVVGATQGERYSGRMMPGFDFRFPSRQGIDPRYAQAQALASTVGDVFHATPEKGLELLRKAIHSQVPEVSGWAAKSLSAVSPHDLIEERAEAIAGKLPLAADIAVDEAMTKAHGQEWLNSNDRKLLLDNLARSKPIEYEAWLIERHLDLVSQHLGIAPLQHVASKGDRMLVDAITAAIGNATFPLEARRVLVASLGRMARRNYPIAVPALHHVLQTATEKRIRVQAESEISRSPSDTATGPSK